MKGLTGIMTLAVLASASPAQADVLIDIPHQRIKSGVPLPVFKADANWPDLPDDIILGQIPGLAVDREDTVWVLHRPNSLDATDVGLAADPPTTIGCCRRAKSVLRFDQEGRLLSEWGGPENAPDIEGANQWPSNVHGLDATDDGTIWIGGNGKGDHVVLNFSPDGTYLRQFGVIGVTEGNASRSSLGNPSDIAGSGGPVLVSDGYINKRVVALDATSLEMSGMWGAYGKLPTAPEREGAFDQSQASSTSDGGANPQSPDYGDIVHCVVRGPDSTVYVCDRRNNRVQLYRESDAGLEFLRDIVIAPETGGLRTASDVAFSPDGAYVYVADMMNGQIWILLRENHEIIGHFGQNGRYPGQFIWLHSIAVDSKGNIYTSEVSTGRRVQRFVFTGFSE